MCGEFSSLPPPAKTGSLLYLTGVRRWQKHGGKSKWTEGWTFLLSEEFTDIIIRFFSITQSLLYRCFSQRVGIGCWCDSSFSRTWIFLTWQQLRRLAQVQSYHQNGGKKKGLQVILNMVNKVVFGQTSSPENGPRRENIQWEAVVWRSLLMSWVKGQNGDRKLK